MAENGTGPFGVCFFLSHRSVAFHLFQAKCCQFEEYIPENSKKQLFSLHNYFVYLNQISMLKHLKGDLINFFIIVY